MIVEVSSNNLNGGSASGWRRENPVFALALQVPVMVVAVAYVNVKQLQQ